MGGANKIPASARDVRSPGQDGGGRGTPPSPRRIQRRGSKGWKMPGNTVYVGRPSKWGNPFKVSKLVSAAKCVRIYRAWLTGTFTEKSLERIIGQGVKCPAQPLAILPYLLARGILREKARTELRGKNLACWCRLDRPCHADVLLEIANS